MNFLGDFEIATNYVDENKGLIRPVLEQSVAGILPEIMRNWSLDIELDSSHVSNSDFSSKLDENYPQGYDHIVFLICDGIGVEHLSRINGLLWDNLTTRGTIASTMFPSMTSTVMTSLSYGRYPSDHGLLGYNILNEHLNSVWNALNLQYNTPENPIHVLEKVELSNLIEGRPLIDLITENYPTVPVDFISPIELKSPSLMDLINPNIKNIEYSNPQQLIQLIIDRLNQDVPNQLTAVYMGYADHFGHQFGPESHQYEEAIRLIEMVVSKIMEHPKIQAGSTAVVLTSDHGQVQIDHDISFWMTRPQWLEYTKKGMLFSTSGRVLHGYARDCDPEQVMETMIEFAGDHGIVLPNSEAMALSGGSLKYSQRMGDYVMLMEDGYLYDVPEIVPYGDPVKLHGQHGSLTAKELFVPVAMF